MRSRAQEDRLMFGMSLVLAIISLVRRSRPRTVAGRDDAPAADQFLIVPLRIHILKTPRPGDG